MSEPLFLAVLLLTLLVAEGARGKPDNASAVARTTHDSDALIAGLLAGSATLVRTHGLAALGAIVLAYLSRRAWRRAAISLLAGCVIILPWMVWQRVNSGAVPPALQGAYGSYGAWIGASIQARGGDMFMQALKGNSQEAFYTVLGMIGYTRVRTIAALLSGILVVLTIIGARLMWYRARVTVLFLALYVALVLLWPTPPARYIWGIWPILMLVPLCGARAVRQSRPESTPQRALRTVGLSSAFLLGSAYVLAMLIGYRDRHWLSIPRTGGGMLRPLVAGVRANTSANEVIASPAEAAIYLYTGRRAVPIYRYSGEPAEPSTYDEAAAQLQSVLSVYQVNAVIASPRTDSAIAHLSPSIARGLVERARFGDYVVYRESH